jgi:pyrroloquinoline quinone biosynthesis protein E
VNLVTSGLGLTPERLAALRGVDHVQLSVQDADEAGANLIAGARAFEPKLRAAEAVRAAGLPLTVNVVLHRLNVDHVDALVALAERMGADRLELANTQYYGWALRNRSALLPSREQLEHAEEVTRAARERLRGRTDVIYVIPDYYAQYPKPCMGGWGSRQLVVGPEGNAWPCLAAHELPLPPANVQEHDLAWIWRSSPMFTAFRGTDWMPDPCASCERREVDLGGCRCQAFQLTGDMARTDPVCVLSPDRHLIDEAVAAANDPAGPAAPAREPVLVPVPELVSRPHRAD